VIRTAVLGASGYLGGELLRLLTGHPRVAVVAAGSARLAGRPVTGPHPNLRGRTDLVFTPPDDLPDCDVLLLARPHGEAMHTIAGLLDRAACVIDLSADFRLHDPAVYARHYDRPHATPDLLGSFETGLPELYRDRLAGAGRIAVPGCLATAAVLALAPLAEAGLVAGDVVVDGRIGSSGSGASAGSFNLHAERSGAMRVVSPAGHRHEAEITQALGVPVRMSVTGVEAVRGAQVLCRVPVAAPVDEGTLRRLYRDRYSGEPFVRVVAQRRGLHRLPEPKLLAGSNICDVGFAVRADGTEVVAIGALDNLVKGGSGNAVQSLNARCGWPEDTGLEFPGLHPI
jgi:LysW-gamma-L-alpha-aminoadipyl-6-phosphate/LysW-L-glutamyl-5-phosphate reductase